MGRHFQRGIALYDLRRYREAVDAFTEEMIEQPYSGAAVAMRAASWLNFGRVRYAQRDILEALRLEPNFAFSHYILSCVRSRQGRARQAQAAIVHALQLEQQPVYFYRLAEIELAQSHFAAALGVVEEGLALDPWDADCLIMRGRCLASLGRHREARDCLRAILTRNPENPTAHATFGRLKLEAGQTAEAADALREARRLNPVDHNDRNALAAAYGRLLWPLSVLDRCLIRVHTWTPSRRWLLLAAMSTLLLFMTAFLHPYVTLPILAVVFNLLAATITMNEVAIPVGMMAFRKDLDIAWYWLLPQAIRVVLVVLVHAVITLAAVGSALVPPVASLFIGFIPNFDLILSLLRKSNLGETIVFGIFAFITVCMPIALACVFLLDSELFPVAILSWLIALGFSYVLTIHWR